MSSNHNFPQWLRVACPVVVLCAFTFVALGVAVGFVTSPLVVSPIVWLSYVAFCRVVGPADGPTFTQRTLTLAGELKKLISKNGATGGAAAKAESQLPSVFIDETG